MRPTNAPSTPMPSSSRCSARTRSPCSCWPAPPASTSPEAAMPAPATPTYEDVLAAAVRLAGHAHHTPVLRSRTVDAATGAQFFFKCENFQRMGAFKFRGAFNALSCFDAAQRRAGVVAFSSGNHAQAIALAARLLDKIGRASCRGGVERDGGGGSGGERDRDDKG